jgi:hypothetical protein
MHTILAASRLAIKMTWPDAYRATGIHGAFPSTCCARSSTSHCVFRKSVTGGFGVVTDDFGNVTGDFGAVTEGF